MKLASVIPKKIMTLPELLRFVTSRRVTGSTISFTNGVFDILHEGHIFSLSKAAMEADLLVVGLNSDDSVKRLKGSERPVNNENARALLLASLVMVDAVVLFTDNTPLEMVKALMPDVMVKGGDYTFEQIAGAKEVMANGGRVVINPLIAGISTTGIIMRMRNNA